MLVYKLSRSAIRLPLIKKLHWLSCCTIFSNPHQVYIAITDHRLSLDKPRINLVFGIWTKSVCCFAGAQNPKATSLTPVEFSISSGVGTHHGKSRLVSQDDSALATRRHLHHIQHAISSSPFWSCYVIGFYCLLKFTVFFHSGCSKVTCISLTREASIKLSPLHGKQISIRYLDMTDCFVLEDEGLHTIAAHCTQLTHLYLRRCVRITDEGLRYLMIYCTSVKELSVSDCRFVSDFGMREIAKLESRLRYLSIAHCGRITDVGIRYIAKYCSKLRYLNARGCEGITDHGVEYLAKNCTKLKSLDIGKCPLVSDTGLEFLALNCFNLKRLSLKSCESITGQGLQIVAANCFDLQMLNVQDCDVSVDALRFVKRHCKRCIIEHTNPAFF